MAIKLLKVGNSFNVPQKTYICDTETERDNLQAYFGDLALVIESGLTYILNSEGTWMDYPTGGGGGADTTLIAPDFEDTETYPQHTLICYDGKLYRALTNVPAGEWDETKWEEVNIASAKADLIGGKVPASQLPSYVDDVIEGYYYNSNFYSDSAHTSQITAEPGKIYIDIPSSTSYRWGGATFAPVAYGTLVEPDWEETDSTNPNFIKNKTHGLVRDQGMIPDGWRGDWASAPIPSYYTISDFGLEGDGVARLYQISDDPTQQLDLDSVESFAKCYYRAEFGEGNPIVGYYAGYGLWNDHIYGYANDCLEFARIGYEIPDLTTESLIALLNQATTDVNSVDNDFNWFDTNANLEEYLRFCQNTYWAQYLLKVKEAGTYTITNNSGDTVSLTLDAGWYFLERTADLRGEELTMEINLTPYAFSSIQTLNPRYLDPTIQELPSRFANSLPLEIAVDFISDQFVPNKYYNSGEVIIQGFMPYMAIQPFTAGETFDANDWELMDSGYPIILYLYGGNQKVYYDDLIQAVESGRTVRIYFEGMHPYEFSTNYYDQEVINNTTYKVFSIEHEETNTVWKLYICSYYNKSAASNYNNGHIIPFMAESSIALIPEGINTVVTQYTNDANTTKALLRKSIKDGRVMAAGFTLYGNHQNIVLSTSKDDVQEPWIIYFEPQTASIKKSVYTTENTIVTTTLLPDLTGGSDGDVLKKVNGVWSFGSVIHIGGSAPSDTSKIWIDTGNGDVIKVYNQNQWIQVGGSNVEFSQSELNEILSSLGGETA